ncbi:MAG: HYR domain-containing protein, partial [Bacteroidetes bacterium]|nr:HYR domain-containing protein [Bacteroidota bacterium]
MQALLHLQISAFTKRCLLFVLMSLFFMLSLPEKAAALNPADVTITMTTAPFFIADSNSPPATDGPRTAYVGFEVCNVSGATLNDLTAEMSSITGTVPGFGLAGGQAASWFVGTLQAGECQTYYWFVEYPYLLKDEIGTFEVTVSDLNPGVATGTGDVFTRSSISANAGGIVNSVTLGPGIYVGQVFYYDVVYSFGNVQSADEFTIQPVGNETFDASCYQLVNNEIIASDLGGVGIPVGAQNQLYFTATGNKGGSGNLVTVRYFFRSLCIGVAATADPYAGQTSGNTNFKYTGNFGENTLPIPPSSNVINITKSASPDYFEMPPGVVTYTIVIENTSDQLVQVDRIDDILPGTFEYDDLTVSSEVTPTNSSMLPAMGSTGAITWVGNEPEAYPYFSYLIDPMSTITLQYTANIPAGHPTGVFENSATATTGTYTTPPATATVSIGACELTIDCPANITVNNDPGVCEAIVTYDDPVATGTCEPLSIVRTMGPASGSAFPVGTTTIEYEVTDNDGNVATCSFVVTVIDNEAPTITCPSDITVSNDPGECSAVVDYTITTDDNCPGETLTLISGLASGSVFPVGTTTVVYEVEDASGNTASCSFNVIVEDNENPTLTCPVNQTLSNDPGECSANLVYDVPFSDNCPGATLAQTSGLPSGSDFPIGTTTNTFTVTDGAGNEVSCSFTVTVTDDEDPSLSCPADITVNNDAGLCSAVVNYSVTFDDNCPGATLTQTAGQASGTAFPVGTTTNTFEVEDASGNIVSCSFTVTVIDNEDPTINCPADITVSNDASLCSAVVDYTVNFDDNCPGATLTQLAGQASGTAFPVGTTTNTFEVEDASNNTATCSFTVTVNDTENPTISCPSNIAVNNDPGVCGAEVTYTVTFDDNCPGATLTQTAGFASGAIFPIGTTTNTFEVEDASGNTATCSFTVTVTDNENPTISCPSNIAVNNDPGVCGAEVTYTVTFDDNCPGATLTQTAGFASGAIFPIGTTTNTFEVEDASGNTATCSFTVTVTDNENPTISCPSNIAVNNDPGVCGAEVTYTVTFDDNCPGATLTQTAGFASGAIFPIGTTTNTFEVEDASGNTATCSFDVTVTDNEDPTISCPADITVNTAGGACDATVNYTVSFDDNCPGEILTQLAGLPSGSDFPLGTTTNTFEVEDASGNTATCSFDVTVEESGGAPTINCPSNITVNNDAGLCSAVVDYEVTYNECPGYVLTQTGGLASGSAFPVGTTTNTFELDDGMGTIVSCSFTVTVVDNENPTISCPSNIAVDTDPGVCGAEVTYTVTFDDNCPGESLSQTAGLASGEVFPVGTTTNTFVVTDASDNTATCSFTVTVTDNENPSISCPSDVSISNDAGLCSAVYTYTVTFDDNCPGSTITQTAGFASGSAFPLGTTTNTFVVTDPSGNTATCSFDVTVTDDEDPTITCPSDITVSNTSGQCGANVTYTVNFDDNCPGASINQTAGFPSGSFFPVGTTTNTFVVTDGAGNTATCSFDVTVNDTENPTVNCPANFVLPNEPGLCSAAVDYTVTFDDNCPGASIMQTAGLASGSDFPVGTTVNTFVVTDAANNTASCSFNVTVNDTESPTITCPGDFNVGSDAGICGAVINYTVTIDDNCPGAILTQTAGLPSGSVFPVGTTVNTFQVTDASGNIAVCSFTVTVTEDVDPTVTCPADMNLVAPAGMCGTLVNYDVIFDDNCPDPFIVQYAGLPSGSFFPLGTTTNCFIVYDQSGNNSECCFDITVTEDVDPTISCPIDLIVTAEEGECGAEVDDILPVFDDNCGIESLTYQLAGATVGMSSATGINDASGTYFEVGVTIIEYTVTDEAGNTATCAFTVQVDDNEDPVFLNCPGDLTVNNDVDKCGANVIFSIPVATDNCGIDNVTQTAGPVSGDYLEVGTHTITFVATDENGNTAECTFTIEVMDMQFPDILCPSSPQVFGTNGADCDYDVSGTSLDATADDNCDVTSFTHDYAAAPSNTTLDGASFPIGNTTVTWTALDAAGNTVTCSHTIVVEDDVAPTIETACPADITQSNDAGICGAVVTYDPPTFEDNCDGTGLAGTLVEGLASGEEFPVGTTTVTYEYTDAGGNSVSCSFTVTVEDDENPEITCPTDVTVEIDGSITGGPATLVSSGPCGVTISYMAPVGTDNCPGALTLLTSGLGAGPNYYEYGGIYTEAYQVVDAAGNTASCSFTVTVDDAVPPLITCPVDMTLPNDPGVCGAVVNYSYPISTDNCPGYTITQTAGPSSGSVFSIGTTTVSFEIEDDAGNVTSCTFDVTIVDVEAPIVACPGNMELTADADCMAVIPDLVSTPLPTYAQGFEDPGFMTGDANDWLPFNSNLDRVLSGTNGIASAEGGAHGVITPSGDPQTGVFTRMGGYQSDFNSGFTTSLDVYIDLNDPAVLADTYGWDLSSAVSDPAGNHRRDFIFHTASNAAGEVLVGGSNNTNFTRRNDLA